jgi:hypothetical protein
MKCKPTGECYVGSTTQTLEKRYWQHKTSAYKKLAPSNFYRCMRVFAGDKYWDIELLEECPGATTGELREREQAHIDMLNPVLNTHNAIREAS